MHMSALFVVLDLSTMTISVFVSHNSTVTILVANKKNAQETKAAGTLIKQVRLVPSLGFEKTWRTVHVQANVCYISRRFCSNQK